MIFDLHSHTLCSDGALTPSELVARAVAKGVCHLAITDHDTVDAYRNLAVPSGLTLIPGIEFSTRWNKIGVHILGLNIDPESAAISEGVLFQQEARWQRAEYIAEKLEKYGLADALEGARGLASADNIGRPHFARYMVVSGFVRNEQEAFKRYLGAGKPCDIRQHWAEPQQVLDWIRAAGGSAVLAHPAKYNLTRARLSALATDFKRWGGEGLEVVSGRQLPGTTRDLAGLCEAQGLAASWGSDFHRPGQPWAELGAYSSPPGHLRPVWESW